MLKERFLLCIYVAASYICIHYFKAHLLGHFNRPDTVEIGMNKNWAHPQEFVSLLGERAGVLYTVSNTVKV